MIEKGYTIGLVGNPNCGKTTLFNALTGTRQRVGNWPGVTVERKSGSYFHAQTEYEVVDLPGTYSVIADVQGDSLDEQIAQQFILNKEADLIINVLDASSLERGLYLTSQLYDAGIPMIVALNMVDVAHNKGMHLDHQVLAERLGCPVIPLIASRGDGLVTLMDMIENRIQKGACLSRPYDFSTEIERQLSDLQSHLIHNNPEASPLLATLLLEQAKYPDDFDHVPLESASSELIQSRYAWVDDVCNDVIQQHHHEKKTIGERIDDLVLNRVLALPIFLGVMYLLFLFAINFGSAFIDFFDLTAAAIFVETPRWLLSAIGSPEWLTTFIADGVGGGIQLVASFIPVIAALFLALSFLEDVGYMARAAFIIDRMMRSLGLPGKAFVPLIVGFGCNVPAVMAARTLNREGDRLVTTMMAPFMSCGARLTVYALFAAAFFPENGQNIVFALYLIGIAVAVLTAFLMRRFMLPAQGSSFIMELPPYLLPTTRNLFMHTWHRLKGFVMRAGKAIVLVVIVLNVLNSVGTDGSFGNENQENSVLSEVGKTITPIFTPMGIEEDNWPATVGIFTGLFAKEVVVGTLDALYSKGESTVEEFNLVDAIGEAFATIPVNVMDVLSNLTDPLGLDMGDLNDTQTIAASQEIQVTTLGALQTFFVTPWAAFSYLLFILLYMPCVATVGAIVKEHGNYWAGFSMLWSFSVAYVLAVGVYQIAMWSLHPTSSAIWVISLLLWQSLLTVWILRSGKRQAAKENLIPLVQVK
ncbi:Fe(2+) transporter permease subunit FeoB [Oceaniserpentilla sp. 4NH20-0058]|uniref:Fe(2+) transporter permease subunit FeoB n=1 Tax=Oceaniserpentilla sp. 4NH20-0058 TaxID=3127660 RepID=UPI003102F95D